ncbi:MAG TPA: GNAT family N-acetyltransferase [Dehalococcoidia bacterium]|jgi:GNAT superfamily N-acetyltransferase|nr:GNAT family N-acetyltransferase [Dehalococcoidia bacterium]
MRIRPVQGTEWPPLRELWLRALAEAPEALGGSAQEAAAWPEAVWRQRAAPAPDRATFVAEDGGAWLGVVVAEHEPAQADTAPSVLLHSLWVDPVARRRGVGRQLVEAVVAWAAERRARSVVLDVAEANAAAIALYATSGFHPSEPASTSGMVRMVRALLR